MSEYQYYEFLAIDHPLTPAQMAEVREFSTRAEITATRFVKGSACEDGKPAEAVGSGQALSLGLAHLIAAGDSQREVC